MEVLEKTNERGYHLYHFYPVDKERYLKERAASKQNPHAVVQQTQGGSIVYPLNAIAAQYNEIKNTSMRKMMDYIRE